MSIENRAIALKAEGAAEVLAATLTAQGHTVEVNNYRFDRNGWGFRRFFLAVPSRVNGQNVRVEIFPIATRDGDLTGRVRFKVSSQDHAWHGCDWSSDAKDFREPKTRAFDFVKIAATLVEFGAKKKREQEKRRLAEQRREENKRAAKRVRDAVGAVSALELRGSHHTSKNGALVTVAYGAHKLTEARALKVAQAIKAALAE